MQFADFQRILVHQATLPYLDEMLEATGIPADRVECTVGDLGNMASASLPVAYSQARVRGAIRPGDRVMWLGLASGISVGVMMMEV
jgi:3-oxoacyl-[acyl-carrier-protein] synthase III